MSTKARLSKAQAEITRLNYELNASITQNMKLLSEIQKNEAFANYLIQKIIKLEDFRG